jgi:hypothetical protein
MVKTLMVEIHAEWAFWPRSPSRGKFDAAFPAHLPAVAFRGHPHPHLANPGMEAAQRPQ